MRPYPIRWRPEPLIKQYGCEPGWGEGNAEGVLDSYPGSGIKVTSEGSHVNECGQYCQTKRRQNRGTNVTYYLGECQYVIHQTSIPVKAVVIPARFHMWNTVRDSCAAW